MRVVGVAGEASRDVLRSGYPEGSEDSEGEVAPGGVAWGAFQAHL